MAHSISYQIFLEAIKVVLDSSKSSMLLLYILWDNWPIFMISSSYEQLRQQLEYTYKSLIVTAEEFQKCNLDVGTL